MSKLDDLIQKILDRQDIQTIIQTHRMIYKPIIGNILLALTGIGLLAILYKAGAHYLDSVRKQESISFNQSLFFTETKSQKLLQQTEHAGSDLKEILGLYAIRK